MNILTHWAICIALTTLGFIGLRLLRPDIDFNIPMILIVSSIIFALAQRNKG